MNPFEKGNRYESVGNKVRSYFSESKYYQNAALLELHYLRNLLGIEFDESNNTVSINDSIPAEAFNCINSLIKYIEDHDLFYKNILPDIKRLEEVYNHDIVAVQYCIIEMVRQGDVTLKGGIKLKNLVHWGLTSQDVVNTVYTKMTFDYIHDDFEKSFQKFEYSFQKFFSDNIMIIGKTHGQNALPMQTSHIFNVFSDRFEKITKCINNLDVKVKFGNGAIGNNYTQNLFNKNFNVINNKTIKDFFGYICEYPLDEFTFQNNYYPYILDVLYQMHKLCHVLKDLSVDMWLYSSMGYIKKGFEAAEHGSSTMPQKSNPIEFENSEGNLDMAIGIIEIYLRKLNISRLQRDLSDVTVMRNLGSVFCYIEQSLESLTKGFDKFKWYAPTASVNVADNDYLKEFIQLREKLLPSSMSYESIKSMSIADVNDYMHRHSK